MKFTIITVCYNSEKTIERTLLSVLAQSYSEVEYILIDGGSSDLTLDIIKKYETTFRDKGYEYKWISETDRGMYDAMNKGIHMASGDVIGILNSDDWYEDDALSNVAESIKRGRADIYMGAIRIFNGNQVIIKKARDRKYKTSRDFNHPAMFVTKECYEDIGDYEIDNVHDDYGWYLKAMKMNQHVCIIDTILTNYPTGGVGSKKSFKNSIKRIVTKYSVYKENEYSRMYFCECASQEILKYILLK